MMKVKLGDIGAILTGNTPKTSDGKNYISKDINFIKPSDIDEDKITNISTSDYFISELAKNDARILPVGSILVTCIGIIGKVGINSIECAFNQQINAIIPDTRKCNNKFLAYAIQFKKNELQQLANAPVVPILNKTQFSNIQICLPLIEKQNKIVAILDMINEIINKRQQQLKKLDELVKSRFIEQIGTIKDTKFKITELESLCEFIKDGTHQTPTYTDDKIHGFKFLSSKDVTTRKISWNKVKYITPDLHKQLYSVIAPKRGDILLAKNGTIGYAAVVDNDEIFDIYVSLALLRPKKENDVYYLWAAINNNETKAQFISSLKGIGVPNLHLREIKKTKIIVPPIDIQREFSYFITQTNKSKLEIKKSLDKLEILKKSLMQEYFS